MKNDRLQLIPVSNFLLSLTVVVSLAACAPAETATPVSTNTPTREVLSTPSTTMPTSTPSLTPTTAVPSTVTATMPPTSTLSSDCLKEVEDLNLTFDSLFSFLYPDIDPGLLTYFDSGGSAVCLEAALTRLYGSQLAEATPEPVKARVLEVDVTDDQRLDVLMGVTIPYGNGYGEAHLLAFVNRVEGYEAQIVFRRAGAGSAAEGLYRGGGVLIHDIMDLNRDSVTEILFSVSWTYETDVFIGQWDGTQFASLIKQYDEEYFQWLYWIAVIEGDIEIVDQEDDGIFELIITTKPYVPEVGMRPKRPRTEIWGWDGASYTLTEVNYGQPEHRFQAVCYGDDASSYGDYENALALYQQAIFDESLLGWSQGYSPDSPDPLVPDPDEWPRLGAYARYRILVLHVFRGYLEEAEIVYDSLQTKHPVGSVAGAYAELATTFWDTYLLTNSLADACDGAARFALERESEVLHPLGTDFYGENGREYAAEDVCPFK